MGAASDVLRWCVLDEQFLENLWDENDLCADDIREYLCEEEQMDINAWIRETLYFLSGMFLDRVEEYAKENNIDFKSDNYDVYVYTNFLDSGFDCSLNDYDLSSKDDKYFDDFLKKEGFKDGKKNV